jgi:hypothetical protein
MQRETNFNSCFTVGANLKCYKLISLGTNWLERNLLPKSFTTCCIINNNVREDITIWQTFFHVHHLLVVTYTDDWPS